MRQPGTFSTAATHTPAQSAARTAVEYAATFSTAYARAPSTSPFGKSTGVATWGSQRSVPEWSKDQNI